MMDFPAVVRRWGDSLCVTIPKRVAERAALLPGQRVSVELKARPPLAEIFGQGKRYLQDETPEKMLRRVKEARRELWRERW